MAAPIQPQHDLSAIEIDEIEEWIYNYNQRAIGRNDARGLGLVISRRGGTHDRGRRWIFFGQALPNSNRCGSMRHIEDVVMRGSY